MKPLDKFKKESSLLLMLTPFFFALLSGKMLDSISAYVEFIPTAFGAILTLAGTLFCIDGIQEKTRRYTIITGISLILVVAFDYRYYTYIHYFGAITFFVSSIVSMLISVDKKKLKTAVLIAFTMVALMVFTTIFFNIFWAEIIGMVQVIGWYRYGIKNIK